MKIQLIQTAESDGNWLKVKVDSSTKACISISRGIEEAMSRAKQIFDFYVENKGQDKVIEEVEV